MQAEPLDIKLELTVGSNPVNIPAGSIKGCRLEMGPLGYEGSVDFWQAFDDSQDNAIDNIEDTEQMFLRLSIRSVLDDPKIIPESLVVNGLVTYKTIREVVQEELNEAPVYQRHYKLHFKDAAQVLWRQHYPAVLLTDTTLSDLIKSVTVKGVSLKLDWDFLEESRTVSFLPCGGDVYKTSFYDWLLWLAETYGAHIYYDYSTNSYTLADTKAPKASPVTLIAKQVGDVTVHLPEECRHNVRLLNAYSEAPASDEIEQERSIAGCRRDVVFRQPLASEYASRKTLEGNRLISRGKELEISLKYFPAASFSPNDFIEFSNEFSNSLSWSSGSYRVTHMYVDVTAVEQSAEKGKHDETSAFDVAVSVKAEPEDNEFRHIPKYVQPNYPVYVEGKILSDKGDIPDKTYEIGEDAQSGLEAYLVKIPLWNQDLWVEFMPNTLPSHFFFPAYKAARVLISLWFDHGRIESFLDFGSEVALPQDTQGNHILFGPNSEHKTSMSHIMKDQKPVFALKRTCKVDTELMKIEEGTILLLTQEEESMGASTETFDLTPEVALAKSNLSMAKEEGVGGVTSQFESTSSEVSAAIDAAVAEAATQLSAMDAEISGKISEAETQVSTAVSQIGDKTEEMTDKAKEAKNELLERLKL